MKTIAKYDKGDEVIMSTKTVEGKTTQEVFSVADSRWQNGKWEYQLKEDDGTLRGSDQWYAQAVLYYFK
jgi:hypothetical protein